MKRHGKQLVTELGRLGFHYIWTNNSGGQCYAHPADPKQTEIIVSPSTDERGARAILARARRLAGTTTDVVVDKRRAQQIKERAATARQRLADSRAARERLLQQKASMAAVTRAERLVEQRERELAAIERLMHQPPAGGNTHRGTGQPRHYTGPTT